MSASSGVAMQATGLAGTWGRAPAFDAPALGPGAGTGFAKTLAVAQSSQPARRGEAVRGGEAARSEMAMSGADGPEMVGEFSGQEVPRDRRGLRWAARQLEGAVWRSVVEAMLQPAAGAGGGLFGSGFAGSVYSQWFAEELAGLVAASSVGSLAHAVESELEGALGERSSRG